MKGKVSGNYETTRYPPWSSSTPEHDCLSILRINIINAKYLFCACFMFTAVKNKTITTHLCDHYQLSITFSSVEGRPTLSQV